jgi:hypothetical protein
MRWRKHYARIIKRFAILPVKAHPPGEEIDFEYRWLETVYLRQSRDFFLGVFPIWKNWKFVTEDQYCAYRAELKNETKDEEVTPERHKMALEVMKSCHIDIVNE